MKNREIYKTLNNSEIQLAFKDNELTIILPYRELNGSEQLFRKILFIFAIVSILLSLHALNTIYTSKNISDDEWSRLLFLAFGGLMSLWYFYLFFRKVVPEKIILKPNELVFDSGNSPLYGYEKQDKITGYTYTWRRKIIFRLKYIESLTLSKTKNDLAHILFIENPIKYIFLGYRMSKEEKEWLYRTILKYYNLEHLYHIKEIRNHNFFGF